MAQFEQWFDQDFNEDIKIRHCESTMFTGDNEGAVVGVHLFKGGVAYAGGGSVVGYAKRTDGGKVPLTGSLSGNAASVVIPQAALAYPGPLGVHVVLTSGDEITTILKAIYSVDDTTGIPVDPGQLVPTWEEFLAELAAMRAGTAAAVAAASSANTAASNANSKASAADTAAGAANTAASAANTAASNADAKAALANTAAGTANTAASNADAKAALANTAAGTANTAASNADAKAALANTAASSANTAASNADAKATLANTAASNADTKAALANTAAGTANSAASAANAAAAEIDDMTVAASGLAAGAAPTATISEVSGHKHIAFGIPKGDKGDKGDPGQDGVVIDIGNDQFAFEIDANGDLILYYNAAAAPNFSINSSGDLIYTF